MAQATAPFLDSTFMLLRKFAHGAIAYVPGKTRILKRGALQSPPLRTSLSCRVFTAMAAGCPHLPRELETNLGIDVGLRVRLPAAKTGLIFGAPRTWVGERASLGLARALLKDSDCFVDIGSNVGIFIYYLRCQGDRSKPIYFFEPDPDLFSGIQETLARNDLPHVHGFQVAVADTTGSGTFYRNRSDDSSGTLVKEDWMMHSLQPMELHTTTFAEFAAECKVDNDCVKVDVEGAEERVWEGMKDKLDRINALIIEVLGPACSRGFPARMIRDSGLNAYYINDYSLERSSRGEFTYVAPFYNWLLCREPPTALSHRLQGAGFTVKDAQAGPA